MAGKQQNFARLMRERIERGEFASGTYLPSERDLAQEYHLGRITVREGLKMLRDMTKIIIAQRITSIMDADQIIVMEHGTISDVGTHDELMKRSEIYREVYESQVREEADA